MTAMAFFVPAFIAVGIFPAIWEAIQHWSTWTRHLTIVASSIVYIVLWVFALISGYHADRLSGIEELKKKQAAAAARQQAATQKQEEEARRETEQREEEARRETEQRRAEQQAEQLVRRERDKALEREVDKWRRRARILPLHDPTFREAYIKLNFKRILEDD